MVSESIPFSTKTTLILLIQHFFLQKTSIFVKNSTFTQMNGVRAVLEIFYFRFHFLPEKKLLLMKFLSFTDYASGIRPPNCSK